jgi:hypothetical protein
MMKRRSTTKTFITTLAQRMMRRAYRNWDGAAAGKTQHLLLSAIRTVSAHGCSPLVRAIASSYQRIGRIDQEPVLELPMTASTPCSNEAAAPPDVTAFRAMRATATGYMLSRAAVLVSSTKLIAPSPSSAIY